MILIVDDESESRKLMTAMLTDEGYQVRAADGGKLALGSIAIRRPELILLDIRMPEMDGFEVCRRLKEDVNSRDIPLIFLSASAQLSERVEGFRLGAVDFIIKPFHREELLARVRTHLELGRLRNQLERRVAERTAELQESEERFRTMADAAPVMIWVAGTDKLCIFVNKNWLEFTGRSLDQELGTGWAKGVHPDDFQRCYSTYSSSFDERQAFQMEYRLRRADGEYRWILDRGIPRFAANGVFAGYLGSCVDITDLKQEHDKMVAVQKLESLGMMAAGIAHDFGNLLAGICGEADVALSAMSPDSPGRECVENVATLAMHAAEIVNMVMASAGAGVDSNAVEAIDISFLVEEMLRLMTASVSKQACVSANLAKDLPAVHGNVAQIRQVVLNLITNASEALRGQRGFITLTTEGVYLGPGSAISNVTNLPDGNYVRLTVTDTGCGMSAETRAKIFDQFFTTKSLGRGLGLAVVHGIVRSHGGAIRVVSAPLAGATFEILLPYAKSSRI
jgi:two-component system cell cycle sensor histidine kinase/response regulator CckA